MGVFGLKTHSWFAMVLVLSQEGICRMSIFLFIQLIRAYYWPSVGGGQSYLGNLHGLQ